MYNSFGYLNTVGYAKHIFPVVMVRSSRAGWHQLPCTQAACGLCNLPETQYVLC